MTVMTPLVDSALLTRLDSVFREVLELPADAPTASLAYRDTPQWDSVAHMQLVVALEGAFEVMLETEQVLALSSYHEARSILRAHGVAV